MKSFMWRL